MPPPRNAVLRAGGSSPPVNRPMEQGVELPAGAVSRVRRHDSGLRSLVGAGLESLRDGGQAAREFAGLRPPWYGARKDVGWPVECRPPRIRRAGQQDARSRVGAGTESNEGNE